MVECQPERIGDNGIDQRICCSVCQCEADLCVCESAAMTLMEESNHA